MAAQVGDPNDFETWMAATRQRVDEALESFFREKFSEAEQLSAESRELVQEVWSLTMRGGKRLRPIVISASFAAVAPEQDLAKTTCVGAALELLQSYLLIHDDWMDQDSERRGGPAAHYVFAERHDDVHLGASLGVLAGDLASTYSWELLLAAPFPRSRRDEALALFVQLQTEVFAGQQLDLIAHSDVERMHDLKTGSYTVRGPTLLGGLLGDATPEQLDALLAWSQPLGVAFQLRDDLLGTFGESSATGKPGEDLRHGKRNAVIAEFERLVPAEEQGLFLRVWGDRQADDELVREAIRLLDASGAKACVEERLIALSEQSSRLLEQSNLHGRGKALLGEVTQRLTMRRH